MTVMLECHLELLVEYFLLANSNKSMHIFHTKQESAE